MKPVIICTLLSSVLSFMLLTSRAEAGEGVGSYGILVGSNLPGENQEALRSSHEDAARMGAVLSEVGGFVPENLTLLTDPDRQTLTDAIDAVQNIIESRHEQNEQSMFLFYYSGHARARALSLGNDEFPLEEIRSRLEALPATVKIVILDACQTGAFSRVKGADPAADFSHNSISTLRTSGMAVMASSTASELSQESDLLQGSFFTHHLTVGLRGAADGDRNGQVTLHEAYRYAYNQTLVATAGTAVGKQHVTLETDMKGKGEMVLSEPEAATARLLFPAPLKAEILVYRADDRTILAEAHKAEGLEMGLAFPPDDYAVLVRQGDTARECEIALGEDQTVSLDVSQCRLLEPEPVTVKQAEAEAAQKETPKETAQVPPQMPPTETPEETPKTEPFKWRPLFEITVGGLLTSTNDAYYDTLRTFGYKRDAGAVNLYYSAFAGVNVNRNLAFGAFYSSLDKIKEGEIAYWSNYNLGQYVFWQSHRFGAAVRGSLPVLDDRMIPFIELGVGATVSKVSYSSISGEPFLLSKDDIHWGYAVSGSAGLIGMVSRHFGLLCRAAYIFAPAIENLYGEKHNSGGFAFSGGLHITL